MLYAFLFLQNLTLCRTRWEHEKQAMRRTCHCPTFAPCESHQGGGMFFPFQITQWAVLMSVCWRYWQRVQQHLCQPFLDPYLAPSAACSSIRVSASSCVQGDSSCSLITSEQRSSFPRVVTTTPGKVSVDTLSLRRLNSCVLFPFSRRNWWQFPGIFLLPSTLIRTPVPLFILVAALKLAFLYSSNITSTRWIDFTNWLTDSDCWYKCVTFRYFCHFLARPGGKIKDFFALCHKFQCRDAGKVICLSHGRIAVHFLLLDHSRYYPLLMLWIHQCLV